MLGLKLPTPSRWLKQVREHLDEVLIDHAHCERKAATTAMSLIGWYVDRPALVRQLSPIVTEELEHFQLVLHLLSDRGVTFRRIRPSSYGRRLHELIDRQEPLRAVDRMLVAGLIEARSCERFALLRDHLEEKRLAEFYGGLFESEARHHATYVRMAKQFAPEKLVNNRLEYLAAREAEIIREGDAVPRMHS